MNGEGRRGGGPLGSKIKKLRNENRKRKIRLIWKIPHSCSRSRDYSDLLMTHIVTYIIYSISLNNVFTYNQFFQVMESFEVELNGKN